MVYLSCKLLEAQQALRQHLLEHLCGSGKPWLCSLHLLQLDLDLLSHPMCKCTGLQVPQHHLAFANLWWCQDKKHLKDSTQHH